jgi:hypothetical protein
MKQSYNVYKLYDRPVPQDIMPMSIHELEKQQRSNYTTFDLLIRNEIKTRQSAKATCYCLLLLRNECQCICLSILSFTNLFNDNKTIL